MARKATPTKKTKKVGAKSSTVSVSRVGEDFKNSALVVSVLINLLIFIGWLVLQVTSQYDYQVAKFLFL